jgi:para-aminobenzoate N-oxygenase AurF
VTDTLALDEEQHADRFNELVARLSHQSVVKHFDAYADVPWDEPEYAIALDDARWELGAGEGLGSTDWYRAQPPDVRARIGLHLIVGNMKAGLQFENILKRGLLEYAFRLPDHRPEFRYAYHEVIEEAQHSLMFQEFVNRSGLDAPGLTWDLKLGTRRVIAMAKHFPELFFVFVLGGEDPIDHVQRTVLRSGRDLHPLLERIMRIHVTEEARHLSFARQYLRTRVPELPAWKRRVIAFEAPVILAVMASVMMRPPRRLVRDYAIPKPVLREVYGKDAPSRDEVRASLRKVRNLLVEVGLVTPVSKRLWRALGIWEAPNGS